MTRNVKPRTPKSMLKDLVASLSRLKEKVEARIDEMRYNTSSDGIVLGTHAHEAALEDLLELGNIETFLIRLAELMEKLLSESKRGRALFVPGLDELARKASFVITPPHQTSGQQTNSKVILHIATEVYPIGGHTRVIEDIAAALPEYKHILVITSMFESDPVWTSLKPRFDMLKLEVHLLRSLTLTEKAIELSSQITALQPLAVLITAHQFDSVAYVGVSAHAAPRVIFLHHADHQPSLGAYRLDFTHVDVTPACHNVCVSHPDLRASLLNLTIADNGTVRLVERDRLIGVTCGTPHKYAGFREFSYPQVVAALLSSGVDRVFHIGDMPAWQKDQICEVIAASGQNARQMVFLPNTKSLTAKLLEIAPDFYLISHPIPGGKATVEALSVGLPTLWPCPASTPRLMAPDMTFATSILVANLGQVPPAIRRLKLEKTMLARQSREVYEKYYSPGAFREGWLSVIKGHR